MDVQIYNRNLELTDRLTEYVDKKVEKFPRYLPGIENIRVDLAATKHRDVSKRMVAQITIRVPGTILRAEERAGDIFAAFDAVIDKIYRRIERFKGRRSSRRTELPASVLEADLSEVVEDEEEVVPTGKVVRIKRFEVSSVMPEDAIEQMELLGHYFYIFLDGSDGRLSVIYKREDGDYGLLKPIY